MAAAAAGSEHQFDVKRCQSMNSSLPDSVELQALVYTVVRLGRTDQSEHAECNHHSELAFVADILAAAVAAEIDYGQNVAHSSVIQVVRTVPVLDAAELAFAAAFALGSDRLDLASAYFETSAARYGHAVAAPAAVPAAYSLVRDAVASGVARVVVAVEVVFATERNVEADDAEREVQHFDPSAVAAALHSGPSADVEQNSGRPAAAAAAVVEAVGAAAAAL